MDIRFFRGWAARHAAKSALAALAAYALVTTLELKQGYWAVITAVIVMQASLGGSVRAGATRIVGTGLGAAAGAACLVLAGGNAPIALGLGVFATVLVCSNVPSLRESSRVAGITAAIVVLVAAPGEGPVLTAASRFLEIVLGITIALGVSLFVLPSRAGRAILPGLARTLSGLADLHAQVFEAMDSGNVAQQKMFHLKDRTARLILRNRQLLEESRVEPSLKRGTDLLASLCRSTERLYEHVLSLDHVVEDSLAREDGEDVLHGHMAAELAALAAETGAALRGVAALLEGKTAGVDVEPLARARAVARDRLVEIRRDRTPSTYGLGEVMRFFSFAHDMLACGAETASLAAKARELRSRNR